MLEFEKITKEKGVFQRRRQEQTLSWVRSMIDEHLHTIFFQNPVVKGRIPEVQEAVLGGKISPSQAVTELVEVFDQSALR